MIKLMTLLLLIFTLASCGGGSGPEKESSLMGLTSSYYPQGLSNHLITQKRDIFAPMDITAQELTMNFDVATQTVTGHSVMTFKLKKNGRPYFELIATPTNMKLDQMATSTTSIADPDGQDQTYWAVDQDLSVNELHEVEFDYILPADRVTFTDGGARFLTDMTDLHGKFFEYWGPCGFEGDAFALKLNLNVLNGTSSHKLRTNGTITKSEASTWEIVFPDYFSKSSFYVHLTNQSGLYTKTLTYQGLEKNIPIEVYGVTEGLVNEAISQLPGLFKELEDDYGAYPHEKFLAYMNNRGGGMEYVGATITSVASIDHELLHSWFARSVMPADGRSGWIDEAMASWRDYGYQRASEVMNRKATNLANYSPFRKTTPTNCYVDGRALFAELDLEFAHIGGMKSIMRAFFKKYKNSAITNKDFWDFIASFTRENVDKFSSHYALGDINPGITPMVSALKTSFSPLEVSKHPTPLTREEILKLR